MPVTFVGKCQSTGHTLFSHTDTPSSSEGTSPFQVLELAYDFARFNPRGRGFDAARRHPRGPRGILRKVDSR